MAIIKSKTKPTDELFLSNQAAMEMLVEKLQKDIATIKLGGGERAIAHQRQKGKLPVRERISHLLDDGSNFLEIGQFAAWQVYDESIPCAGVVAGIGMIEGVQCMVIANDPSVKGGTYYPLTVKKHLRAQEIAQRCQLPCVYLVDSGGANLLINQTFFPIKITSAVSSSTKPECRPKAFLKSPLLWGCAPQAALMSQQWQTCR